MRIPILQRYLLKQFTSVLLVALFAAVALFIVFDFFDRVDNFFKAEANVGQVLEYLLYKIPLIVHLMMPVALLVATLIGVGRLAQLSEVTAMRASGASIVWLAFPLLLVGLSISVVMFFMGETIVPLATKRVQEIYQLDIRKKAEKGNYSQENFWYRSGDRFYSVNFYDSRSSTLEGLSIFDFDENFNLTRRIDAEQASWKGDAVGWVMDNVVESRFDLLGQTTTSNFKQLPLTISETPQDFYSVKFRPETLSFRELWELIAKFKKENVPVTPYVVAMHAKVSFPFVNLIVILIAFPFSLTPARSGSMTKSFIFGVTIGFSYYVVHALSTSFGSAELIPAIPAAWAANVLLGCLGGYFILGADYS